MRKFIYSVPTIFLLIVVALTGCSDDYDDVAPGSWTDTEHIETFPGDTVLVTGTVSNSSPIENVSLVCEAWGINQVYERKAFNDKVFNYGYKLIVPANATFNQHLTVLAKCENGKITTREIPISFLPDTKAPTVTSTLNSEIGIDFDSQTGTALWNMKLDICDDRNLASVVIDIPGISYYEIFEIKGRNALIERNIEFIDVGAFPCEITISDSAGNKSSYNLNIMSMLAEVENPISDYEGIYVINANESPEDYIDGYYRWMERQAEFIYQGKFYAPTDNSKIYFTPNRNLDGDLYGVSPYVLSKLMNNNGYVLPVTIEKAGYYGVYVDLQAHSYSIWKLEMPEHYTNDLFITGTGLPHPDWTFADPMTRNGYRYTQNLTISAGEIRYCFSTADWADGFRSDVDGKWWYQYAGGSMRTFTTNYSGSVVVTLDVAHPWATIKKAK